MFPFLKYVLRKKDDYKSLSVLSQHLQTFTFQAISEQRGFSLFLQRVCLLVTCESRCLCGVPAESWKGFLLTQFVLDGLQDAVGVTEHAGRSGADLDVVLSHWLTQEHGVESRYFINPHWSNAQDLCHLQEKAKNHIRHWLVNALRALNQKYENLNKKKKQLRTFIY